MSATDHPTIVPPTEQIGTGWLRAAAIAYVLAIPATAVLAPALLPPLLVAPVLVMGSMRSPRDAVSVLSLFVAFQVVLPERFVLPALGAAGRPALLIGLAALLLVGWGMLGSSFRIAGHVPWVWVVVGLVVASSLISYVSAHTRVLLPIEERAMQRWLLFVFSLSGIALLTATGIDSRERLVTLLRRLVLVMSISAFVGILQFTTSIDLAQMIRVPGLTELHLFVSEGRSLFRRVIGTAGHPIEFSVVMAMTLPFAMHFAVIDRGKRPWAARLQLALIAASVPMAISRSGVLCLALAVPLVVITWPSRLRVQAAVAGVFFLAAMRAAFPGLLGTIRSLFVNIIGDPSTTGRTQDYVHVADFFARNPWFGRGGYTFLPELYTTLDNQWLLTLVDSGIVGIAVLVTVFLAGVGLARSARRLTPDPADRDLCQCIVGALVGAAATFATFDALSFTTVSAMVFLLVGCAGALWRLNRRAAAAD